METRYKPVTPSPRPVQSAPRSSVFHLQVLPSVLFTFVRPSPSPPHRMCPPHSKNIFTERQPSILPPPADTFLHIQPE